MLFGYTAQTDKAKATHFKSRGESYYYCLILGTRTDSRGRGLASSLIRDYQVVAKKAGFPIWLEATTAHSRDLYIKCGFQALDTVILGKGTHDELGEMHAGGVGVTIWPMVWYPETVNRGLETQPM